MNPARPWLMHGIGFQKNEEAVGGGTGGSGGAGGTGTGVAPKTLEQVLKEHPHLAGELDQRTASVATREKDQGKRSALQEFAKGLGVGDGNPDVIAEAYRRYSEQQSANMSEAEKILADAKKAQAEAETAKAEAAQARFDAVAIKVLSKAQAEAPEVMAASLARFGVTVESTEEDIAKAVEEMKKVLPGSFGIKTSGTPGGAGPGTPPAGTPNGSKTGSDKLGDLAKSQIERRATRNGKAPIPTL